MNRLCLEFFGNLGQSHIRKLAFLCLKPKMKCKTIHTLKNRLSTIKSPECTFWPWMSTNLILIPSQSWLSGQLLVFFHCTKTIHWLTFGIRILYFSHGQGVRRILLENLLVWNNLVTARSNGNKITLAVLPEANCSQNITVRSKKIAHWIIRLTTFDFYFDIIFRKLSRSWRQCLASPVCRKFNISSTSTSTTTSDTISFDERPSPEKSWARCRFLNTRWSHEPFTIKRSLNGEYSLLVVHALQYLWPGCQYALLHRLGNARK